MHFPLGQTLRAGNRRNRTQRPKLKVERLEIRDVPSATLALDFNTNASPTAPGYTGVKLITYASPLAMGWQSTAGMGSISRTSSNPLTRDLHYGTDNTFVADVPDGEYDVVVGLGDQSQSRDKMSVWVEGQLLASDVKTRSGKFVEIRARMTVTDGQLTVRVADAGGSNPRFALTKLILNPVDPNAPSLWPDGNVPTVASVSTKSATELGVRFQSAVDGFVTGVRFYKGTANSGIHTGSLWTADGTRIATATFANESSSGWQQVYFDSPVPIQSNTTYVASYFAPKGRYAFDAEYFAYSGLSSGELSVYSSPEGGGGVFASGSNYPASNNQNGNFWVDINFTRETDPPTVTQVTPADQASGVALASTVKVEFSEAMHASTINASTFLVKTPDGSNVAGSVAYSPSTLTATFTPSANFSAGTTYTVVIKGGSGSTVVRDVAGNALAADFTSTFGTATNPPSANAGADKSGDESSSLSFSGSASGGTGALTYHWDFGDGETVEGTLTPTHTYADNGSYTVTLTVTDGNNQAASDTAIATVSNVDPTASVSNNGPVVTSATVTISFANQDDVSTPDKNAGFKYSYDFDNNGTWELTDVSAATADTTYSTAGDKVVKARIKDKDGGFTDYTTTVTVNGVPTANAGADKSGNEASSISFSGSASGGTGTLTYHWDFGDGEAVEGTLTPTHTYADNGSYTVTLTVTDGNNQTATDTAIATVSNVAPTASLSNNGPVPTGATVTISFANQNDVSTPDKNAGFKYSYDFDNNGTWELTDVSAATADTTYSTAGNKVIKARIKDKDGGFTDYTTTVTVTSVPSANAGADKSGNEASSISFNGSASGGTGTLTYHWDFGDGTSVDGTLSPSHTYADNGTYTVTLTVTDGASQTATDTAVATIANLAPTGSLGSNGPVLTGADVTISFTNQADASSVDHAAGYHYSYDFDNDGGWDVDNVTSSAATTSFSTAGAKTVRAKIIDKDGGLSVYTTTVQVNQGNPPNAPSDLKVAPVSQSEINLNWELGDAIDTQVVIERKTGSSGTYKVLSVLPGGENTYTDTSTWASTTYFYRVKARNAGGDSGYSAELSSITSAVPTGALAVVSNLQAVVNSPTTATITFTDTNTATSSRMYLLERSSDGMAYQVIRSLGTGTSHIDEGLTPGAIYFYRVRGASWSKPTSNYSPPASVTLSSLAQGAAIAPSALEATALSSSSVKLTWTNNDPTNPQFKVERASYNAWGSQTWNQIAVTAAGATSFTDTGLTAERPYAYRVRATNAQGNSSFGLPASDLMQAVFGSFVGVITASQGTGSPKTYDIGPGQTYTSIGALNWSILGPGDTVNIHYKSGGYHEIFQVATRGTPTAWITIKGIPDPSTGALPFIDGENAVLAPQFQNHYAPLSGSGAIVVGTKPGFVAGYKPGYISIQNLQIQKAYRAYTFTDFDGSTKQYGNLSAGVYLERADHVTIMKCTLTDNGEGIFGAGQSGMDRLMTDITLDSNYIYGNGNPNSYLEHNTYLEGIDTVYQFNKYGPLRSGAGGAGLKDRSVGTIIRYNYIEGGAHQLQLPEAQNQSALAMTLPRYHQMWVYGNTLIAEPWNPNSPIWFGGDQGLDVFNRKGVLYLYNNSIVSRSSQSQVWRINAVQMSSGGESLDARNNIFTALPSTPGATPPNFGLLNGYANAYFGKNWVSAGFQMTSDNSGYSGNAGGTANLITGSSNDPGFVSPSEGDYHLAAGSVAIDVSSRMSGCTLPYLVSWEYVDPHSGEDRSIVGNGVDLGAFEFGN